MGDRLTIAEARARRTDPEWRRRHKVADITGVALVGLVLVLPLVAAALSPPAGLAVLVALVTAAAAVVGWGGPAVGFERKAGMLLAVPVLNLVVLVPAVWRSAHLHLQRWHGPLEPQWDDGVWLAATAAAAVSWVALIAGAVLLLT